MTTVHIKVVGLDKVIRGLNRFPREISRYIQQAADESAKRVILPTQGLQKYPPMTDANRLPTPYYIRGRGMQYKTRNLGNSERYGTQFYVEHKSYLQTAIGNRASYARYLGGEEQAVAMERKGWRKLFDVAIEKLPLIVKIYNDWISKLIRDLRL